MIPHLLIRIGSRYLPMLAVSVGDVAITDLGADDVGLTALVKALAALTEALARDRAMAKVVVVEVALYATEVEDAAVTALAVAERLIADVDVTEEPT